MSLLARLDDPAPDERDHGLREHRPRPEPTTEAPRTAWSWLDLLAALALIGWTWVSRAADFWTHNWVAIDWGDWGDQAYRVKYLATWGLVNWDPDWNRGLPIFQSYQTLPHAAALAIMRLTGAGVPHSMMVAVAILLLVYPVSGFVVLRALGCGIPGALLGAVLLTDLPALAFPIRDYSSLFGTAAVPLLFWVVLGALGTRRGYLGGVLLGLSVYLHPFALVAGAALLVARLLHQRDWSRRMAAQLGVAVMIASFYWLPLITSARPRFEDPWNWSQGFEQSVLPHEGLLGLSFGLLLAVAAAYLLARAGRLRTAGLTTIGLTAATLMGLAAVAAYFGALPRQLMETDPVRWIPNLATILALAAAPAGDAGWAWARERRLGASSPSPTGALVLGALLLGAVAIEGSTWFQRSNLPVADSVNYGADLTTWADAQKLTAPTLIWAATDDVANSSFVNFGRFQYTADYVSQRQWTQTSPVLQELMQDTVAGMPARTGRFDLIEPYLRMYGVEYVYLPRFGPSTPSFLRGPLSGRLVRVADVPGGFVLKVPWTPVQAFVAPAAAVRATTLPDSAFLTFAEQRDRDRLVGQYAALAYSPAAAPAQLTWRGPTHVTVSAQARPGTLVVVPQNWDTVWEARVDGQRVGVSRVGPNYLAVDLGTRTGAVEVELVHAPYLSWSVAIALGCLGLSIAVVATVIDRARPPAATVVAPVPAAPPTP
jgi:hypothetical protein